MFVVHENAGTGFGLVRNIPNRTNLHTPYFGMIWLSIVRMDSDVTF